MHIHILGIAGTMTANLAVSLKKLGHQITGSDQDKIYPPISTLLKKANIKINYYEVTSDIDLCIVGSSYKAFKNTQEEFLQIKKLKIPYISATKYISQNIVKNDSIVIAGSYGKTTITSLISWVFIKAKKKPSYMFGGIPKNKFNSISFSNSNFSIVEGDESIHGLDKHAKFIYYSPRYLILTSANWEHKDCYKTETANFNAYKQLVSKIPKDGLLLINNQDATAKKVSQYSIAPIITYNSIDSNYFIDRIHTKQNLTTLVINTPNGLIKVNTQLIGQFNFENILATVALCDYLKIKTNILQKAIFSYRGIKRRLELVAEYKKILFFDDFAQSSIRIKSTLIALKNQYPTCRLRVFYQPHASFNQYQTSLSGFNDAFTPAFEVVLGQIKFLSKGNPKNRITARKYQEAIGSKLIYLPLRQQVLKYYRDSLMPNDILIYMSSGGLESNRIFKSIINSFKK